MLINAGPSMDKILCRGGVGWYVYGLFVAILLSRKWTVKVDQVS